MTQIEVKLNPDVTPTGSDLSVVNAARRSFGSRSEWETVYLSFQELEESGRTYDDWKVVDTFYEPYAGYRLQRLKEKDKNLLRFLARGMSTKDWEEFLNEVALSHSWMDDFAVDPIPEDKLPDLTELLWKWRNTPTHEAPFNHTFISFEYKAPLNTRSQLVKHEYLINSEISRRYHIDDVEFYEPDYRIQSKDKKQGSYGIHPDNTKWQVLSRENAERAINLYNKMVEAGVAIEQARGELPQNMMVEVTWSGTLGAFSKMCRERLDPHSQYESRVVAQKVYDYLKEYYPVSAPLLIEGVY